MPLGRNLEQTPSLIDADVADDVRRVNAGVSIAGGTDGTEAGRQVEDRGTVELVGTVDTNTAGHAVAELPSVLDVIHTGNGVFAAEQRRRLFTLIIVPVHSAS